jgi:hypothetical protein
MLPRLWTRKELALIAAIVALACVAALLSIKLTRPRLLSSDTLGVELQCKHSLLMKMNCAKIAHVAPVEPAGQADLSAPGAGSESFQQSL